MPVATSINRPTSSLVRPRNKTLWNIRSLTSSPRLSASGCCRDNSMSRYVPTSNNLLPASSLATNCNNSRDGLSDQCKSSRTSTKGCFNEAVFKKALIESNNLNLACSGSRLVAAGNPGSRSRTSDTISAISEAPAPISALNSWGSFSLTYDRIA